MRIIIEFFQRKKAAKRQVRLTSLSNFDKGCKLRMEANSRLGNVAVDQTQSAESLLVIGAYSYVRSGSRLLCISEIGRFCSIGRNVTLGQNPRNHPLDWVSTSTQFSRHYHRKVPSLTIGHDVWIGDNAVVMAGIKIGHGAVIGCDAVVTKDVLPYQVVAGNPAKPIRFRLDETLVCSLLESEWWQFDKSELDSIDFEHVSDFTDAVSTLRRYANYDVIELDGHRIKFGS